MIECKKQNKNKNISHNFLLMNKKNTNKINNLCVNEENDYQMWKEVISGFVKNN